MKKDELHESLIEALSWASLGELPEVDTKGSIWLKALALTTRMNGRKGYVAMVRDRNGDNKVMKDFYPSTSAIHTIDEIYPYLYLDGNMLPKFDNKLGKDERLAWLEENDKGVDYSSCTVKELNKAILNVVAYRFVKDGVRY